MEFEQGSGVGNWISNTASDAWTGVKAKGKGALIYLDQNFHEHILAPENDSGRKRK